MNRRILFYIAAMLICGSSIAQEVQHYPLNPHDFPNNMNLIAKICINGVEQTSNAIEIGAFNGSTVTGSKRIQEYGSNHYFRINMLVYGNSSSYEVTFKLYNHDTGDELNNCIVTYEENPYTVIWESDASHGKYKNPVVLNFVTTPTQTFTKEITGYGNSNGNWYLIASPLVDETNPENVGGMLNNSFDLYRFNQSAPSNDQGITLEWENWKNQSQEHYHFNLESGKGYLYANSGDVTLTFTGTAYTGNGEVTLVKEDNADFAGWNLVGNPFAQTAYISKPFYTTNPDGTGIIAGTGNNIGAMEGIFVIANTDGETMTFSTEQRDEQNQQFALNVNRNRGNIIDRAIVRFNDETTLPKFTLNRNSTKLYIPQNGEDYAMVSSEGICEMPINFKAEENGAYTLSFDAQGVSFDYLHLIDNMTGNDIDLLAGASTLRVVSGTSSTATYTFEAKTTDYASRFKLVFATICEDADSDNDFAFFSNGKLVILNDGHATFQVVDLMGRTVMSETINGSANINVNVVPGVYMLRLANGDDIKTQKIVME